ncbi:MAG TPA: flagellar hook-associated protein FlgL [Acidimicrobiales bacterium]|nr:flagellar hook-associated protein FlgL [Acidimicrobiales bacterium]
MPPFRVTQSTISANVLAGLQTNLERMQGIQNRLSSGKQLNRPSDSPSGVLDAMGYRANLRRLDQYTRNADDGLGWLGTADQSLTSSLDLVRRARDLMVGAGNAGLSQESRDAMASELDSIRASLLSVANTRYGDRPIFAGTSAVTDAYTAAGAYQGDAGAVERSVGQGARVTVNLTGPEVFGPAAGGGPSIFDVLATAATDLRSGNPVQLANVTSADLSALDGWRTRIQDQLSVVGARYNRIETMRTRADDSTSTISQRLSDVEDVDLPKAVTELQMQQVAYQAALAASARVVQPSLVDFLR